MTGRRLVAASESAPSEADPSHDCAGGAVSEASQESVLQEAERIINGERRADYGDARKSFQLIADLWSPVVGAQVTAEQVAVCMIQLKVARALNGFQRDSLVDIAGYSGCLARLRGIDP